jgi:hypothetical protein
LLAQAMIHNWGKNEKAKKTIDNIVSNCHAAIAAGCGADAHGFLFWVRDSS